MGTLRDSGWIGVDWAAGWIWAYLSRTMPFGGFLLLLLGGLEKTRESGRDDAQGRKVHVTGADSGEQKETIRLGEARSVKVKDYAVWWVSSAAFRGSKASIFPFASLELGLAENEREWKRRRSRKKSALKEIEVDRKAWRGEQKETDRLGEARSVKVKPVVASTMSPVCDFHFFLIPIPDYAVWWVSSAAFRGSKASIFPFASLELGLGENEREWKRRRSRKKSSKRLKLIGRLRKESKRKPSDWEKLEASRSRVLCPFRSVNSGFSGCWIDHLVTTRGGFNNLGEMIATHKRLKEQSQFLFIPGPDDVGPSTGLPRCALPNYLTEELQKNIPMSYFQATLAIRQKP
ncbi:hypothetical protein V8G54_013290 [Vigna mungo]|uniref:DNA polymerase II subunit 2 n=1 Tax=Vigna mungo TaxID=3915 RepID=A0AAQ3S4T2_VIGMU